MRRILLAAVSLVLGVGVGGQATAAEGAVTSTVNRLFYYEGHTGLLVIVNSMSDLGGCGNASWFLLPDGHPHFKEVVALLMSAEAGGKQVNLTVSGCYEGYGRIKHVMLID
ncbi:MAG: hypothetical protein ABI769_13065 [Pseudomonadota bacterium]